MDISDALLAAYSSPVHKKRFPYTVIKWGPYMPHKLVHKNCLIQAWNEYIFQKNILTIEELAKS